MRIPRRSRSSGHLQILSRDLTLMLVILAGFVRDRVIHSPEYRTRTLSVDSLGGVCSYHLSLMSMKSMMVM